MGNCVAKARRFSMNVVDGTTVVSPYAGLVGYDSEDEAVSALRVLQERLEAEDPDCCSDGSLMEVLVDLLSDTSPTLQTEALRTIQLVLEHEPEDMPRGPSLLDCGLLTRIRASIDAGSDHSGVIIAGFACAEAVLVESRGSALSKVIDAGLIDVALQTAAMVKPDVDATQERLGALEFLLAAAQRVPMALKDHFSADNFVDNVSRLCKVESTEDGSINRTAKKILRALERKCVLTAEKLKELLPESGDCSSMGSTKVLDQSDGTDKEVETVKNGELPIKEAVKDNNNNERVNEKCDDGSDYENA